MISLMNQFTWVYLLRYCESSCVCVWVDWEKSDAQRKKEQMLLEELVSIVNKRDELVQQRDYEEKGSVRDALP